jgi:hypothetical protein
MTTAERTRMSLRRRTVLATVLATAISAIGSAGAVKADAPADLVDLTVVDRDTGQPMRTWRHDGRLFVAGQPGARYGLRVTNHTAGRVLVVMSVDGVNIVTGETAGYGQRGYVFGPYESYDVSGWRKSDTEVAAFTFAPLAQSYAARTGRPGDVGVIGIVAFRERVVAPADSSISEVVVTGQRAAPAPPAAKAAPSDALAAAERSTEKLGREKLGTGHGAREWSAAYTVPFERASAYPQQIRRVEYDSFDNLVASGVIRPPWDAGHRPRPFPSNPGGSGYVPDPPGRP